MVIGARTPGLTNGLAALIGTSISLLFLRTPLSGASAQLHERRQGRVSGQQADADAEDEAVDGTAPVEGRRED